MGTLIVTDSTLSGNQTGIGGIWEFVGPFGFNFVGGDGGSGAGIFNFSGTVTVTHSTLNGNRCGRAGGPAGLGGGFGGSGAGVFNRSGSVTITNSTLSGNQAGCGSSSPAETSNGFGSAIDNRDLLIVTNSTLSGNYNLCDGVDERDRGDTFGIYNEGTATFKNSIITNSGNSGNCATGNGAAFNGSGNNLEAAGGVYDACPGFTQVTSGQLNLGALANNGGPTKNHALQPGSVAIDAGAGGTTPNVPPHNSTNAVLGIAGTRIPGATGPPIQIDNE